VPDVYLPARDDEIKGRLVLAFDTSGSMWYTKDIFRRVLGAIDELLSSFKCEADLIDIDAAVSNHVHIDCGERLEKYSPKGGGGTSFIPAFKWTEENLSEMPDGLIYFTDLDGTFPKHAPQYPVLWVTWNKKHCEPPFGDLLEIEEN
jgi:predicted metal-dependent peptidase